MRQAGKVKSLLNFFLTAFSGPTRFYCEKSDNNQLGSWLVNGNDLPDNNLWKLVSREIYFGKMENYFSNFSLLFRSQVSEGFQSFLFTNNFNFSI